MAFSALNPQQLGMLQAGLGMLAGNRWRPATQGPNTLGGSIGQAGMLGLQAYQEAKQRENEDAYKKLLMAKTLRDLQAKEVKTTKGGGVFSYDPTDPERTLKELRTPDSAGSKAPKSRERKVADEIITEEFDPVKMRWTEVGRAPRYKPSAPQVSVTNVQESAYAKGQGKYYSNLYSELQTDARKVDMRLNNLDAIDKLLENAYTGIGGEAVQSARRLGAAFGLPVENVANVDAARSLANEVALQMRNPAGGAGMPGALSDKDLAFLKEIVPGLAMTAQGRKLLITVHKRLGKRSKDIAAMARKYRGGMIDSGFEDLVAQKFSGSDLFSDLATPSASGMPEAPATGAVLRFDASGNPLP